MRIDGRKMILIRHVAACMHAYHMCYDRHRNLQVRPRSGAFFSVTTLYKGSLLSHVVSWHTLNWIHLNFGLFPYLYHHYHSVVFSVRSPRISEGIYVPFHFHFACVFLLVHSRRSSAAEPLFSCPIEYTFSRGRINRYI